MGVQEAGVYWPFKSLLSGSGIVLTETTSSISIATTGAGPGGGDMLISVFATNGATGVVDKAVSAETVTGVVAHATLADSVPWGGIAGAPTNFPTDWSLIANKPATFVPSPHGTTHVTSDLIPLATTTAVGLTGILSGKATDMRAGDGLLHDLNTTVGSYALTMNALLTCAAGLTMSGGTLTVDGSINQTLGSATLNGPTIINGQGAYCGVLSATPNCFWSWATGTAINKDAIVLYRTAGQTYLVEQYNDVNGAGVWSGRLMNTWNPDGAYTLRATTQLITSCSLPGNNTAWSSASLLINASAAGGFCGIGLNCTSNWACALGAWKSGLWIATSSNTFVQLTDTNGHIVAGALGAGVAVANIGYTPVNRAGDTMTGDLWVNKSAAQIIAYQDGTDYCRMVGSSGIYVIGNFLGSTFGYGQICIDAGPGDPRAGIGMRSSNGYGISIFVNTNGQLVAYRANDGYSKQLLP